MSLNAIARFASGLRWADVPAPVRARTGEALVDTLGVMLGGTRSPGFAAAARHAMVDGGMASRTMAWGTAASALDVDDGHYEGGGVHLGAGILPALLTTQGHPESLLPALLVGYEVSIRTGWLLAPRGSGDPYRTSGAAIAPGAAAAVGHLLGFDADTMASAIRIACAHAPFAGLQLGMAKESIGWGAASGLTAAHLAAQGFDRPAAPDSFLGLPATPFDTALAQSPFVASAGQRWHMLDVYVKPHACCRAIHAALAALDELLAAEPDIASIARIEVATMPGAQGLNAQAPTSAEQAQFSFPWALACRLLRGHVDATACLPETLADDRLRAMARRIIVVADPDMRQSAPDRSYPARVTIIRADGRSATAQCLDAPGSAARPLAPGALHAKFRANARLALPEAESEALLADVIGGLSPAALARRLHPFLSSSLEISA